MIQKDDINNQRNLIEGKMWLREEKSMRNISMQKCIANVPIELRALGHEFGTNLLIAKVKSWHYLSERIVTELFSIQMRMPEIYFSHWNPVDKDFPSYASTVIELFYIHLFPNITLHIIMYIEWAIHLLSPSTGLICPFLNLLLK